MTTSRWISVQQWVLDVLRSEGRPLDIWHTNRGLIDFVFINTFVGQLDLHQEMSQQHA
ncbi:hypothetical protein Krac_6902 [Ktedonobacter racemifer DSM 44963]|uniref:Uncharacterized protein n=1 Tax=Ktedonobacter racemifer DSM 44963 TaxID=485913 RepID=D6TPQ8_KTERA|nr:hypothetical protein Krac_6902 [Ktedonobacter racemifer DSM 44963]